MINYLNLAYNLSINKGLPECLITPDDHKYFQSGKHLFSPYTHQNFKQASFSKKQKRHHMRLRSGMTLADARKERLCFLTLTTEYNKKQPQTRRKKIIKIQISTIRISNDI